MLDVGIFVKISQLKAKFIDSDDSTKQQIADWEKQIQELSLKEGFMGSPVTQEASKLLKLKIKKEMLYRLGQGITDKDRQLSDRAEKELRFALGLFNLKYEQELETLERLIDSELE